MIGSIDPKESTIVQTSEPPMMALEEVRDHAGAVRALVAWDRVGVLIDDGPRAMVTVLLEGNTVVAALRFCLPAVQGVEALRAYSEGSTEPMELRCWQGHKMQSDHTGNLAQLTALWCQSSGERIEQTDDDWRVFFERVESTARNSGRGMAFRTDTRNQVLLDAHGRCMFEGCGVDLTEDPVTGIRGNFATLAHNIASSEGGPRGVLYLSDTLSDDPSNILLLCDTHHRLIDRIATADYPASTLSEMRKRFCGVANRLLDGLALTPTPAYCVAWPVHQQTISLPSSPEIARALKPIGARLDGQLRRVNDNEAGLRRIEARIRWTVMAATVEGTASDILLQTHGEGYRAALFAMGLMPALIALGAKLGNKCDITPMLRYRENSLWYWPLNEPRGEFYTIDGLDQLSDGDGEVCLLLCLTAAPNTMWSTAESLGMKVVSVVAHARYMGNGALGHPDDGASFRQRMQELLHQFRDSYTVRTVHVLPCVSNAACVFFGQAFDSHHPDLLIYDFSSDGIGMVPALRLANVSNECKVEAAGSA